MVRPLAAAPCEELGRVALGGAGAGGGVAALVPALGELVEVRELGLGSGWGWGWG